MNEREEAFAKKFNALVDGFEYSKGYTNSDVSVWIRCNSCNSETIRSSGFLRKVIRGEKNISCGHCSGSEGHQTKRKTIVKSCENCGKAFETNKGNKYCGEQCRKKKRNRRLELKDRSVHAHLKVNGSFDSSITLEKLFDKYDGECYLCEEQCNWEDKKISTEGHFIVGETYPSIEHVLPLSKGGTHTWDNVKLAHYKCNVTKSDKLFYEDKANQITFSI